MSGARRTAVLNVVGLTAGLLDQMPFLQRWARAATRASIGGVLPAVTCSVQSTYLTGRLPSAHGVVGNGWYVRDECEVRFWRQSNQLVQGRKLWDRAREIDPDFTCANLFWWFNMYSSVDASVTPRPMYPADGRKIPDVYTWPTSLRDHLQHRFGRFPLFEFWGPRAGIRSSQWIANAATEVERMFQPTLSLVYLPHLDYGLQRSGPDHASIAGELRQIDGLCESLISFLEGRGVRVIVLSEYAIRAVARAVSLNRVLRQQQLLAVREELGRELLDAGASRAFAVADHQIAHVYVRDEADVPHVHDLLREVEGVQMVLDEEGKRQHGLDHPRSGELVAVAEADSWFTYYYWLDDARAPDFAPTVDIHRKPGYDPAELFLNPDLRMPAARAAFRLAQKKLGFRYLMDLVPIRGDLVRGSHGRIPGLGEERPVLVVPGDAQLLDVEVAPTAVQRVILNSVYPNHAPPPE